MNQMIPFISSEAIPGAQVGSKVPRHHRITTPNTFNMHNIHRQIQTSEEPINLREEVKPRLEQSCQETTANIILHGLYVMFHLSGAAVTQKKS